MKLTTEIEWAHRHRKQLSVCCAHSVSDSDVCPPTLIDTDTYPSPLGFSCDVSVFAEVSQVLVKATLNFSRLIILDWSSSTLFLKDGALQSGIEGCGMCGFRCFRLHLLPPHQPCFHILDVYLFLLWVFPSVSDDVWGPVKIQQGLKKTQRRQNCTTTNCRHMPPRAFSLISRVCI